MSATATMSAAQRGRPAGPGRPAWRGALGRAAVGAAAAVAVGFKHPGAGMAIGAVTAAILALALWLPRAYAGLDRGLAAFGRAVGLALSNTLLTALFALVFMPGRLILRLARRDPMRREFPGREDTFWIPYRPSTDPDHYRKQYR